MPFAAIKNAIPAYAKDIKLNLSSMENDETLSPQQLWGAFLATAMNAGNPAVIAAAENVAKQKLSPAAIEAAKAAAAIMAMNNVYYKFVGMMGDSAYRTMPAKLRMNVIANPGVDKADFELWSLAVSAMNGCQFCVIAHEKVLREMGVTAEQIQTAVRIASIMAAVSAVVDAPALQMDQAQAA